MVAGGKSGPLLLAASALYFLAAIKSFPINCNFTSGPYIDFAHRPYIIVVPVHSTAVRALVKGAIWKAVQDEISSGVRA